MPFPASIFSRAVELSYASPTVITPDGLSGPPSRAFKCSLGASWRQVELDYVAVGTGVSEPDIRLPEIVSQPSDTTVTTGSPTSFAVLISFVPTGTTFQWEINGGAGWSSIVDGGVYSGAQTATLSISSSAGLNGKIYRCTITVPTYDAFSSDEATLTVRTNANFIDVVCTNIGDSCGPNTARMTVTPISDDGATITYEYTIIGGDTANMRLVYPTGITAASALPATGSMTKDAIGAVGIQRYCGAQGGFVGMSHFGDQFQAYWA